MTIAATVRAVDDLLLAAAKLMEVAGLHACDAPGSPGAECVHCGVLWPCETARIIEAVPL